MPVLSEDSGLHETLALLTSQLRPDSNHKEEMVFLRDIFSERSLSCLMKIHEKLCHYEQHSPVPVLHNASALAEDVIEELQTAPMNNDEKELLQLLSTPHLRGNEAWLKKIIAAELHCNELLQIVLGLQQQLRLELLSLRDLVIKHNVT